MNCVELKTFPKNDSYLYTHKHNFCVLCLIELIEEVFLRIIYLVNVTFPKESDYELNNHAKIDKCEKFIFLECVGRK